ncbi:hypothetical protein [Methanobrevibacter sp. V14]|uniref:hypothetical protein n=1 Tax=Methanobrevibacter sp. V14 TaxID=3064280 RepID=UPI0027357E4F|nr:hypothetical protein [Methanobrevibacter sp. V14]
MSYMNDDTDPFGVPYCTRNEGFEEEEKEYSFKGVQDLRLKENDLNVELAEIRRDKEEAIKQIKGRMRTYLDPFAKIECDEHTNWTIIVKTFNLSKLERLKKDFDLDDIRVECCKVEQLSGKYEERIKITLFV